MNPKKEFMRDVIFSNTIQGAFQRIKIYPSEWTDTQRFNFRLKIRSTLDEIAIDYTNRKVSSDEHFVNISKLVENNIISFGVGQKLLNLYLKYLWCLDEVGVPPHCPVDSIILKKVGLPDIRWSKMKRNVYENVIFHIEKVARDAGYENVSEWELEIFNKRNDISV